MTATAVRSDLHRAARAYLELGWRVLPVRPRSKVPLTPNGVDDASSDPGQVEAWWQRWPGANVGIACAPSGLVVIDVDGPDAAERWQQIQRRHGRVGEPLIQQTARGWHFVYRHPGGRLVGRLAEGIDVKANGYILAAPSVHPSGHVYRWHNSRPTDDLPAWLVRLLRPPAPRPNRRRLNGPQRGADSPRRALEGMARKLAAMPPDSGRNDLLNWAAYHAGERVAAGELDEGDVRAVLYDAARASGLGEREIAKTLQSGLAAGMGARSAA